MKNPNQQGTDAAVVQAIREGLPQERDAALNHLFSDSYLFNSTRQFILTHQGNEQDVEDVFQEVFILFERNIGKGNFREESSLHTYFMGIVKHFWKRYKAKRGEIVVFDTQLHDMGEMDLEDPLSDIEKKIVDYALSQLSDKCKELLLLTGSLDTHTEIAEKMGYNNADRARNEVFRCREKFRDLMKKHPELASFLKAIIEK